MKITKTISLDIEVEIEGDYSPYRPGSFYRSNGDPGDPPEYAEFNINSVKFNDMDITSLLDKANFDFSSLEQEIIEIIENEEPDYDD